MSIRLFVFHNSVIINQTSESIFYISWDLQMAQSFSKIIRVETLAFL